MYSDSGSVVEAEMPKRDDVAMAEFDVVSLVSDEVEVCHSLRLMLFFGCKYNAFFLKMHNVFAKTFP